MSEDEKIMKAEYFKLGDSQFLRHVSSNEYIYVRKPRSGNQTSEIWILNVRLDNPWKPCSKKEYDAAFKMAFDVINELNNQNK